MQYAPDHQELIYDAIGFAFLFKSCYQNVVYCNFRKVFHFICLHLSYDKSFNFTNIIILFMVNIGNTNISHAGKFDWFTLNDGQDIASGF